MRNGKLQLSLRMSLLRSPGPRAHVLPGGGHGGIRVTGARCLRGSGQPLWGELGGSLWWQRHRGPRPPPRIPAPRLPEPGAWSALSRLLLSLLPCWSGSDGLGTIRKDIGMGSAGPRRRRAGSPWRGGGASPSPGAQSTRPRVSPPRAQAGRRGRRCSVPLGSQSKWKPGHRTDRQRDEREDERMH